MQNKDCWFKPMTYRRNLHLGPPPPTHHCSPNTTDLCCLEFSIKAAGLIVPLLQLRATRERLAALRKAKHKRRTCKPGGGELRTQSPASREAFQAGREAHDKQDRLEHKQQRKHWEVDVNHWMLPQASFISF